MMCAFDDLYSPICIIKYYYVGYRFCNLRRVIKKIVDYTGKNTAQLQRPLYFMRSNKAPDRS